VLDQGVELAAGVHGAGAGGDDAGFPEGDQMLQGGMQATSPPATDHHASGMEI
jgi:hypothetical protein